MAGDHIIRATVPGVRGFAAITTNLVEEARRRHGCYPVTAAALGRTMTAALLLADNNLKTDEGITIRINGDGPAGAIVADAKPGSVRGYVQHPQVELPLRGCKLDVGRAVGQGEIYVTRFTGLKQPFTGAAPLISGEIAEDVTNYLMVSEQTPSSVALGVLIDTDYTAIAAGGFIIQPLPDVENAVLTVIEENLHNLPAVSVLVKDGFDAGQLLARVFAHLPVRYYEQRSVQFQCQCSRERVAQMLIDLGPAELQAMMADGRAEVCCHFCGDKYNFTVDELAQLFAVATEHRE